MSFDGLVGAHRLFSTQPGLQLSLVELRPSAHGVEDDGAPAARAKVVERCKGCVLRLDKLRPRLPTLRNLLRHQVAHLPRQGGGGGG